ncbi:hypothetical protein HK405_001990, partial [Cladochytrium tenue]
AAAKGRRQRAKESAAAATRARPITFSGIDLGSFVLYLVLSLVFYAAVIGWFFNIPVFQRLVVTPATAVVHYGVYVPFHAVRHYVALFTSYSAELLSVLTSGRYYQFEKKLDPFAAPEVLRDGRGVFDEGF